MALQTHLESTTERDWNKEKMELLERFDNERKEWECQWKVMQKKIEELYQEVKLRRESNMNAFENKAIHSKAPPPARSPSLEWTKTPGQNNSSPDKESFPIKAEKESKDTRNKRRNHVFAKDHLVLESCKESKDCPGLKPSKNYTQDLNIALKELAKVSEDLCSYQEEIRKKSNNKRKKFYPSLGESAETENTLITAQEMNHVHQSVSQPASILFEIEKQNNNKNLIGTSLKEIPSSALTGVEKSTFLLWQTRDAPPVPPRSTSRHLASSLAQVSEAFVKDLGQWSGSPTKESPDANAFNHPSFAKQRDAPVSPSVLSGPSVATTGSIEKGDPSLECKPMSGFCHNTWSCDASKVGGCAQNGSSQPVQKSCSDGNMMPSKHLLKCQNNVHCTRDCYTPICDTLGDSGYGTGKTQRNETLEAKIDEFNRTVFHTDKAQKCLQQNQALSVPPGDPKLCCLQQDGLPSKTQNEESLGVLNRKPSFKKDEKPCTPSKNIKTTGQQKQLNGLLSGYHHMLHEHAWRPSNLSGRPRSADSRSNYGVVEKLLKNYERSASLWNSNFHQEQWVSTEAKFVEGGCEKASHYFEMLQGDQGKQEQQKTSVKHIGIYTKNSKEKQKFPEVSVPVKQSNGKGFSRPARPANRRLPSRWASRSPSAPPVMRETALNELS
ncbi:uncharacterized protein KIAA0408 homolog [Anolis carolinensis]|uniref:KIAA0408 n=1 Tax=Anolis carolinensis TaxID=28377 RepID=R4GA33_ANOCA|nr:PREDICTED: uncharacterized protein KIAA0408 homolog isoform X1 [Anolis carolinensis]XP_016852217.1 PREDICTED: uncharacterized protein KIAA0408 homolog isoform X1 [Anolis carolinensis]XP_016852218.1 PREDICTED: uncharacterized protein KIAA0408 homolog isoform X1 [Anolis carolinensis]XP_016852219.1 PREDICTED: uncharacterized protein KIAA0408 homolog isoform X1 [Anolis carolinensis]|eukprot:XP_008117176.1 PREDICTED: uncharacterized protein KIAA0408 homolog isoform X1 [Anolis carolinensis]